MASVIRSELDLRVQAGSLNTRESLQQVFVALFGAERAPDERLRFLLFAAPLARRVAIERATSHERIGVGDLSVADLNLWLCCLDTMNPLHARILDLHYFAGLNLKETAAVLNMPLPAVRRDLRFAKAWLRARLTRSSSTAERTVPA